MKKLLFMIGATALVITISSCSTDSIAKDENLKSINQTQLFATPIDSLAPSPNSILDNGDKDKDKVKG